MKPMPISLGPVHAIRHDLCHIESFHCLRLTNQSIVVWHQTDCDGEWILGAIVSDTENSLRAERIARGADPVVFNLDGKLLMVAVDRESGFAHTATVYELEMPSSSRTGKLHAQTVATWVIERLSSRVQPYIENGRIGFVYSGGHRNSCQLFNVYWNLKLTDYTSSVLVDVPGLGDWTLVPMETSVLVLGAIGRELWIRPIHGPLLPAERIFSPLRTKQGERFEHPVIGRLSATWAGRSDIIVLAELCDHSQSIASLGLSIIGAKSQDWRHITTGALFPTICRTDSGMVAGYTQTIAELSGEGIEDSPADGSVQNQASSNALFPKTLIGILDSQGNLMDRFKTLYENTESSWDTAFAVSSGRGHMFWRNGSGPESCRVLTCPFSLK